MRKKLLIVGSLAALLAIVFFLVFHISGRGDNGRIKVKAGQNFTITLESNPTTGYRWQISGKYDTAFVELVDSVFVPGRTDLVGAGGKEEWVFKALRAGKTVISFQYTRPWEKDELPAQEYSVIVVVR